MTPRRDRLPRPNVPEMPLRPRSEPRPLRTPAPRSPWSRSRCSTRRRRRRSAGLRPRDPSCQHHPRQGSCRCEATRHAAGRGTGCPGSHEHTGMARSVSMQAPRHLGRSRALDRTRHVDRSSSSEPRGLICAFHSTHLRNDGWTSRGPPTTRAMLDDSSASADVAVTGSFALAHSRKNGPRLPSSVAPVCPAAG